MKRVSAAAAALFWLGLASQATAGVIYQHAPAWNGNGTSVVTGWTSQVDATNSGYRTFDAFTLASDDVVREVTWYGVYFTANSALHAAAPNTASWDLSFYADNAGTPGSRVFNTSVPVTSRLLGTSPNGQETLSVYSFTAAIGAFSATGGTKYWFSPTSQAATFSPFFSWIEGTGGDGTSYQRMASNGTILTTFDRNGDRAFTLSNTVPEPASLALLGAGLAMVLARRRRS